MKKPSLATLRKKAWSLMSKSVRHTGNAYVPCVTCGRMYPPEEIHAGHFIHISKQHPLSYDPRNIHPQCRQCNFYGMQGEAAIKYTQWMVREYGEGIVDELLELKRSAPYLKRAELEELIERLKNGIECSS